MNKEIFTHRIMIFPFSQGLFYLCSGWSAQIKHGIVVPKISLGGTLWLLLFQTWRTACALLFPALMKDATSFSRLCFIKAGSDPAAGQGQVFMLPSATKQTMDMLLTNLPFSKPNLLDLVKADTCCRWTQWEKKNGLSTTKRGFLHINPKIELKSC